MVRLRRSGRPVWLALALLAIGSPAATQTMATAEDLAPMVELFRHGWTLTDQPMRMTVPVHGGVLEFTMPHGFVPAARADGDGQFFMAFVPDGDTWPDFTRAVLVQSSARLGSAPYPTAEIAEGIFKPRLCAGPALWEALGEEQVGSLVPAFLASTGCPSLSERPEHGQQTFLALLRSDPDAVALSFAQRSPSFAAESPPVGREAARAQIGRFGDIILCRSAEQPRCADILARDKLRETLR